MSIENPTAHKAVAVRELEAEARYAGERYQLLQGEVLQLTTGQSRAPPRARANGEVGEGTAGPGEAVARPGEATTGYPPRGTADTSIEKLTLSC
jgi:hypothetical protein